MIQLRDVAKIYRVGNDDCGKTLFTVELLKDCDDLLARTAVKISRPLRYE